MHFYLVEIYIALKCHYLFFSRIQTANTPACGVAESSKASFALVPNTTYCYPSDVENVADYNYVTPVFLAIYLLIGNVMLLNLLIAIFT